MGLTYGPWLTGFTGMLCRFQEQTGVRPLRDNTTLKTADGQMYVNATWVLGVDVFSPKQFTAAILECYRQIEGVLRFLKENDPGFEQARLGQVSPILGVRETRHFLGEYTLTGRTSRGETRFADSIAVDASALAIHDPKGGDVDFQSMQPYEIPYRSLVPQGVEQRPGRRTLHLGRPRGARALARHAGLHVDRTGREPGVSHRDRWTADGAKVPVGKVQEALRGLRMPLHPEEIRLVER